MAENKQVRRRLPLDIREIIKKRLKDMGKTPHWLSKQQRMVHESTVRSYLYGQKDTTSRVIGELFAIIGLDVTVTEQK